MKISKEPVSAFAVYSEKFKQKKKAKPISDNDIKKVKKGKIPNSNLKMRQMKEIGTVLKKLASQSNIANVDILKNIVAANSKIKMKPVNTIQDETISPHNFRGPVTLAKVGNKHVSSNKPIKKVKKAMKISTAPVKIKNKSLDEHDKSMNILNSNSSPNNVNNQNTNIGPIVIKSFTETISKFSEKTEKVNKPPKKPKTTKETNQVPLKNIASSNIKNKLNAKGKNRKQKKLNGISLNKINPENHVEGNLLLVKKKTNNRNKRSPKASELIRKSNENILQERDWMDKEDSILAGKCLFQWLILPISQQDFMRVYWEKKPLLIKRDENRNYFSELMSTADVDTMLRDNVVCFTKHLDVTSYTDGVRETHNLSGRAQPNVVWDFYSNGCSVRLLNPQIFLPKIHALNATLQEYFGCFVGANVYLTPPNSQGFAPHYDDIEAFVLQIEGKKHWKVYSPRNEQETLPRFSSPNFSQEEIGVPILDVTLEPGDMLYFPRGYIHQASTVDGEHSLHITLSAYQKTAWVDLLEKTLPLALNRAAAEDLEFRRGLPRHYLNIEHCGSDAEKMAFANTAQRLMTRLSHFLGLTLGAGVDQMGAQFMHDALPPVFTPGEKEKTSLGSGLKMEENGKLYNRVEFDMDTKVKLVRANLCRLAEEEGEVRLYHCLDNPLEYHAEEPQFLVLPQEGIRVITHLACCYPAYVQVKKLPHDNEEDLLTLISDLWDAGLLLAIRLQTSSETD